MKLKLGFALFLALSTSAVSHATPITYSIATYASGKLGASTFTNQLVTVSYFGDTANLSSASGTIADTGGVSGVDIGGLGSALFTDSTEFFITGGVNLAGIYDLTTSSTVDSFNAAFGSYAGNTSLGPLVTLYFTLPSYSFTTTKGALVITSLTSTQYLGSFQAVLVPEPSSLLLLGTGVAGLVGSLRRRLF